MISERFGKKVSFFPEHTKMPKHLSADAAMHTAKDLIYALKHPQPATPFDIGDEQLKALETLANIFSKALLERLVLLTSYYV
jgi:hypothetical protein